MTEIYKSQTHGPIPLSFTGRRLLANLREAITDAIALGDYSTNGTNAVARARGDIAVRMSELEQRKVAPADAEVATLREELRRTRDKLESQRRAGQVSEEFRKNPDSRNWETSYTKSVQDKLWAIPYGSLEAPGALNAVIEAGKLLKDYHESQHLVYEQRDAARADAVLLGAHNRDWMALARRFSAKLDAITKLVNFT
jgi:hypothetical protein